MKVQSLRAWRVLVLVTLACVLIPLQSVGAPETPDKLLVGKWRDVHFGSETVEFNSNGRMESTSALGKFPGVYTLVGGKTLDYSLTMPQGIRKTKMTVAFLTANDLILQSSTTKAHTIYKKVIGGKVPGLMDVKKFPEQIVGRWKQAGPKGEAVEFNGKGKMDILEPRPLAGTYSISGDVMEMSLATPSGVRKFKATIVFISPAYLALIYPDNKMSNYTRVAKK